jgi:hypothetical protein
VPYILRKVRKGRWSHEAANSWLGESDLQADALSDLQTSANALSVWTVANDKSNLNDVLTALASNGDSISNIDYALVHFDVLSQLHIEHQAVSGDTPFHNANEFHIDLVQLSALKLLELAKALKRSESIQRIPEKQIRGLIIQAVVSGQISLDQLRPNLSAALQKFLPRGGGPERTVE